MPRNNRGGSNRGGNNRSTSGRPSGNDSSNSSSGRSGGVMDLARDRPVAAAAVAAGAAAAGLFLWSRRAQISDQLTSLSDQIGDWTENFGSGGSDQFGNTGDDTAGLTTGTGSSARRSGMSETGGGNASLGAVSGGSGTTGSTSGRGRARSTPTTPR